MSDHKPSNPHRPAINGLGISHVLGSWAVALCLASFGLLWCSNIPLGIAGEWEWYRIPHEFLAVDGLAVLAVYAAAYIAFVSWVAVSHHRFGSRGRYASWFGLTLAAAGWFTLVQQTAPLSQGFGKGPFVLFYSSHTGYFFKTRYQEPHVTSMLREYESRMSKGDVLHEGTHPPGLYLYYYAARALVENSRFLQHLLTITQTSEVVDAFEIITENQQSRGPGFEVRPADCATLWLTMLFVLTLCATAVIPLGLLVARWSHPTTAWLVASWWPLLPATAIFFPRSDVAFATLGLWMCWSWLEGVNRGSFRWGLLTGFLSCVALLMSLAFLPWGVAMVLLAVTEFVAGSPGKRLTSFKALGSNISGCLVGLGAPLVVFYLVFGLNLLQVWFWNYHNHAGFYRQFTRSYAGWLGVNLIELALSAGVPVVILAGAGLVRAARQSAWRPLCSFAITWGLLWISGKNSGEAARLWALFLPWLLLLMTPVFHHDGQDQVKPVTSPATDWRLWMALQMICCVFTVHRVTGFGMLADKVIQ